MDTAGHAARAQHARTPRPPSSPSSSPGVFYGLTSNGVTAPVPKLGKTLQSGQAEAGAPAHGGEGSKGTADSWGGGQVGGAKPPAPRAGTLPDMSDLEGWEQEEYFVGSPTHVFPLSQPNASEGPPVGPCPKPLPPPRMDRAKDVASVMSGHTDGGIDLCLIDQYLSLVTGREASRGAGDKFDAVGGLMVDCPGEKRTNLMSLRLDRPTLERQGMAPHHINRVYNLLHSNAMAFALTVSAEQRRLAALLTTKPGLPLQDRLLAFVMGSEDDLEDELLPPGSRRAMGQGGKGMHLGEDCVDDEGVRMLAREADLKLAPLSSEDLMKEPDKIVDMDEAVAMAAAGNVVGLQRLLGRYRQLHKAVRGRLEGRLKHEVERAQRLQDQLDAQEAELQENHQQLGLATTEVNSASARVQAVEEELAREHEVVVTGQAINDSLRDEIADVEAQWAAQQAETVARVTDQLQMLQQQSEGELDLREQYLQRLRELVTLQLRHDHEARKAKRLGDELSAVRAAGQAAAAEAAALKVWRGRLEERAENAEGWALASKASAFDGVKAFQKEQAAHKATLDRLHMVEHRVEHARTAAADMHARFSKLIKEQSAAAREANTRAVKLQRQVEEAQDMIRIRAFEVDSAKSAHAAAQQMAERVVRDHFDLQGILARKDEALKEIEQKGAQDSVNVQKLRQEKYVMEAELMAAQKALSDVSGFIQEREKIGAKLVLDEKEIAEMKQSLSEVQATRSGLERQVSFLRVREAELVQLQNAHKGLQTAHTALQQEHMSLKNEHKRASDTIERQEMELENAARRRELDAAALEGAVEQLGKVQEAEHEARNGIKALKARLDVNADDLENLTWTKKRLQDEVAELKKRIGVVADLRSEVACLKQRLQAAERAQSEALADQKWWISARQHMQGDIQEFLAAGAHEAQAIMAMCASVQEGMASLRGSMLGLLEGNAPKEGEPSPLALVDAAKAAKVFAGVGELGARMDALLQTQTKVHQEAMSKLQEAENQQPQQLSDSQEFWLDTLDAARKYPDRMTKVLSSANVTAGVDPEMALSSLVPAFLLEAQAKEISRLRAAEGALQAQHAAAVAQACAIQATLEGERSSDQTRQQHFTALVSMLRDQVLTLQNKLTAAFAGRSLAEKAAFAASKHVAESAYLISKAKEREAVSGMANIVPSRRVDRGVQTTYSELWVNAPPSSAAEVGRRLTLSASVPSWGGDLGSGAVAEPPILRAMREGGSTINRPGSPATAEQPLLLSRSANWAGEKSGAALGGWSRPSSGASTMPYYSTSRPGTASSPMYSAFKAPPPAAGGKDALSPQHTSSSSVFLNRPNSSGAGGGGGSDGGNLWFADPNKPAPVSSLEHSRPISASSTVSTTAPATPSPRSPPRQRDVPNIRAGGGFLVGRGSKRPSSSQHHRPQQPQQQQDMARFPGQASDTVTSGSRLKLAVSGSGEFCSEWDWAAEVEPQLTRVPELLSLQDTMDVIADACRSKEATDELYRLQGRTAPPTMASFLGLFFDVAHSATWGPRPLQPLAQFVASVRHYAHVYEVLAFARAAGILPTHPSATSTSLLRAPDRASPPNSPRIPQRDSAAASSAGVPQQPGSDSPLRPSSAIPRTRPSTAPAAQHAPRPSSSPQHQSFSAGNTTPASQRSPTSSSAAAAPAAGPRLNTSTSRHPTPAIHYGWEERGGKGRQPLLSRRQRQHHQGAAAAAATMLSLVPVPSTNAPPSSPAIPRGGIKIRPGSAMPPSHPRLLSATTTSRAVRANRPATAGTGTGSGTGSTPLGRAQEPSANTSRAGPGAGVQEERGLPVNAGDGSVNVGDGLHWGDSHPVQEHSSAPQPDTRSHSAMPSVDRASHLGQDTVDVTANSEHVHMQHRVHSVAQHAQQDLPQGVVVQRWQAPLPAEHLRCALRTPDMGIAMGALRAASGAEDVVRFVAEGNPMDHLTAADLGHPVQEMMAPDLHALLQSTAVLLGVEVAPDLFLNPRLAEACPPPALPVALLHVPHVSTAGLTSSAKRGPLLPRLKDGTFGWRRRAVLLMQPHLMQCFVQQQQQRQQQQREQARRHWQKKQQRQQQQRRQEERHQQQEQQGVLEGRESGEPPRDGSESAEEAEKVAEHGILQHQQRQQLEGQEEWEEGDQGEEEKLGNEEQVEDKEEVEEEEEGDGGPTPLYSPSEFQALLAMALAPMCMPGGGGWRLDMQRSSKASVAAGNAGVGPKGALAAADAVTTAVLSDLAPEALQPHLSVQLRAKWAALYRYLARTPMGCLTAGDRAALVCVGDLGTVVTAIYKSCVGCACSAECPDATALLAEARLALRHRRANGTSSSSPIVDLSPDSPQAAGPIDLHQLALLRVAALKRWASSSEAMQLMAARSEGAIHQ